MSAPASAGSVVSTGSAAAAASADPVPSIELEAVSFAYPDGTRALAGVSLRSSPARSSQSSARTARASRRWSGTSTGFCDRRRDASCWAGGDSRAVHVARLAAIVGLAFQNPDRQLFAGRVSAEVAFGPRNLGIRGAELAERVDAALEAVGLAGDGGREPVRPGLFAAQAAGARVRAGDEDADPDPRRADHGPGCPGSGTGPGRGGRCRGRGGP